MNAVSSILTSFSKLDTYRTDGRILVGPKGDFADEAVIGIPGLVLGKGDGNGGGCFCCCCCCCCSCLAITLRQQQKGSLLKDHTHFSKNDIGGTVLVHPFVGSTVHLESYGKLVGFQQRWMIMRTFNSAAIVVLALAADANEAVAVVFGFGVDVVFNVVVIVAAVVAPAAAGICCGVGDQIVEIIPIVVVVITIVIAVVAIHRLVICICSVSRGRQLESLELWSAYKRIPVESDKSSFLVQAFDVDIRENAVPLGLRDGKPGFVVDVPPYTGIVEAGTAFSERAVCSTVQR